MTLAKSQKTSLKIPLVDHLSELIVLASPMGDQSSLCQAQWSYHYRTDQAV